MIKREVERLNLLGHTIYVEAATVEKLVREGFHRTLGARPLRNTVDRLLQELATRTVLSNLQRLPNPTPILGQITYRTTGSTGHEGVEWESKQFLTVFERLFKSKGLARKT
jgi:hypothetical protein